MFACLVCTALNYLSDFLTQYTMPFCYLDALNSKHFIKGTKL